MDQILRKGKEKGKEGKIITVDLVIETEIYNEIINGF